MFKTVSNVVSVGTISFGHEMLTALLREEKFPW